MVSEMTGLFLIKLFVRKKKQTETQAHNLKQIGKVGKKNKTENKGLLWKTVSNF